MVHSQIVCLLNEVAAAATAHDHTLPSLCPLFVPAAASLTCPSPPPRPPLHVRCMVHSKVVRLLLLDEVAAADGAGAEAQVADGQAA